MTSTASLKAHLMLSAMESLNKDNEQSFRTFLQETVADEKRHARFLNMLSLLEHLGSRKIMLSQMKGVLTQDVLKHLAEETRHAFFFKREAEKLSGQPLEGYDPADTASPASGRQYFERLDAGLTADFMDKAQREIRYLWVSLIVELRAVWVYRFYQNALAAARNPLSLRSVIAEEDSHLNDMVSRLGELSFDIPSRLNDACLLEKSLFDKLLKVLVADEVAA